VSIAENQQNFYYVCSVDGNPLSESCFMDYRGYFFCYEHAPAGSTLSWRKAKA
jgi:hypothetical protein